MAVDVTEPMTKRRWHELWAWVEAWNPLERDEAFGLLDEVRRLQAEVRDLRGGEAMAKEACRLLAEENARLKQGPEETDGYIRAVADEELRGGPSAG